jgi:DNA-binding PadR family transcriptional regulator
MKALLDLWCRWRSQKPLTQEEIFILASLYPGGKTGIQVHSHIEKWTGENLGLQRIYPILREMRSRGWTDCWEDWSPEVTQKRGGRPRFYWFLTAQGWQIANLELKKIRDLWQF